MKYNEIVQECYTELLPKYKMESIAKSFCNFFVPEIVEAVYRDITENVEFIPHIYGNLTRMHCANRSIGEVYSGDLIHLRETQDSIICREFLKVFESNEFAKFVSYVLGEEVYFVRSATPYKFEQGDYLCFHDDMSDKYHACEVVLNLTKNWHKGYGGYSMGGFIKRRARAKTPDELPFFLNRIILDRSRPNYCALPTFNKLSILKLSSELCHGTSKVKVNKSRYVIAAIFAGKHAKKTTVEWKEEFRP